MNPSTTQVQPGDVVLFTQRSKNGEEKRCGIVLRINADGSFNYDTYYRNSQYLGTGQGRCYPDKIGTKPFGFHCAMEIIGHDATY